MPRKRRPAGRPEMLTRDVEISSFRMTVRLHAVHGRGEEPYVESAIIGARPEHPLC